MSNNCFKKLLQIIQRFLALLMTPLVLLRTSEQEPARDNAVLTGGPRSRRAAYQVLSMAPSTGLTCDEAVIKLLRGDLIEPYDLLIVVTKKVACQLRSNYRPLNGDTKKDPYPLPQIDESLNLVSGSSWFSSLNLWSGYYQVPLAAESRPTTFCTGRGFWQFKNLPFGQ